MKAIRTVATVWLLAVVSGCGAGEGTSADAGTSASVDAGTSASVDAGTSASVDAGTGTERGPGEFRPDFRSSASFFTNMSAPVKGTSPHGTQQTWYSSNVTGLLSSSSFTVPVATVAITEFDTTSDGTSDGYAVMVKRQAGYDPVNNDWYYEMRGVNGAVMAVPAPGKVQMCIDCHQSAMATDFLAATAIR